MKWLLLFFALPLLGGEISGRYDTTFQKMILTQDGDEIYGSYQSQKGRIRGILKGTTLTGTWDEGRSRGKLLFQFSPDFSTFTGKWGYNTAKPTRNWRGKKEKPLPPSTQGIYQVDSRKMVILQSGNRVRGTLSGIYFQGTIRNLVFTGKWHDQKSSGTLTATFSPDFNQFTGKWQTGPEEKLWSGKRITPDQKSFTGFYDSSYGTIALLQNGRDLLGIYSYKDGVLTGKVDGDQFNGIWYEARSKRSGKAIFKFTPNFLQFSGKWGYNKAAPGSTWNGTKFDLQKRIQKPLEKPEPKTVKDVIGDHPPKGQEGSSLKVIDQMDQPAGTKPVDDDDDEAPADW